ncbi:MAG TPA: glycosyltransferase family 39 protein [Rudaea sp.]|nr:glycosyltransferase family 39 protein [Rudaea sp.]
MNAPKSAAAGHASLSQRCALGAILAGALALRLWGAFADLPYIYHPDEPQNIVAIQHILATHDANPHLFLYPALLYYVNVAVALVVKTLPAWLAGDTPTYAAPISIAMGATFAPDASAVASYRLVSIVGGVGSVLLVYLIGKRARDVSTGLLAALLAACSPLLAADSRNVLPDSYVVFFELVTLLAALAIAAGGRRSAYLAAGFAVGACAASKYNGALVCLFPLAAHLVRSGASPRAAGPLVLAGVVSAVAFMLLTPYTLLDPATFAGIGYQYHTYSSRHQGMEGNVPLWYLGTLWRTTGLACVLAACQLVRGVRARCAPTLVIAAFALPYLVFISTFVVRNERTLEPVVPCVLLLAVLFLRHLASPSSVLNRAAAGGLRTAALAVLALAVVAAPLRVAVAEAVRLSTVDSRATAREWINTNLPEHAVVAVESYVPYVDPARFRIVQAERAIDHPLAWYADRGAQFFVLSEGLYGRYLAAPREYPDEAARYVALMDSMRLVRRFDDGGYEVLVYEIPRAAP